MPIWMIPRKQQYRKMKEEFGEAEAVKGINKKIKEKSKISDKDLSISVDLATHNSWQTTLMTYLDDIPFHHIGKGEQCIIKTNLALGHRKSQEANLILLEEPENHLSHTKLNQLLKSIEEECAEKQILVSTHNSFVANKLGLKNLILLNNQQSSRFTDLSTITFNFFKKLPGYQTLRLLLCHKAVLVEGDSDELIFQRAYMDANKGKLPIENGIDVMSVGLAFKRFLAIAKEIRQPVAVITDNDEDYETKVTKKYMAFKKINCIKIFADNRNDLDTLEPQFIDANSGNFEKLRDVIIKRNKDDYNNEKDLCDFMLKNKTTWALRVFGSKEKLKFPEYIKKAVKWCHE